MACPVIELACCFCGLDGFTLKSRRGRSSELQASYAWSVGVSRDGLIPILDGEEKDGELRFCIC